jgi:hypothetical protein
MILAAVLTKRLERLSLPPLLPSEDIKVARLRGDDEHGFVFEA